MEESLGGKLVIHRIPPLFKKNSPLSKIFNFPLWINPVWVFLLFSACKKFSISSVIIRDLPLMACGILGKWFFKYSLYFDMAECYPEMYKSMMEAERQSLWKKFLKNPNVADIYETIAAKKSNGIFVMIEESRDRLVKKGIDQTKIEIVSNTPVLRPTHAARHHHGEELRIVYVGFVTKIRGIDIMVEAVEQFIRSAEGGENIRFDIIGVGSHLEYIKSMIKKLGIGDHVQAHGWLDHQEVKDILEKANVGALTYRVCSHWNHTIPNKIFDYMYQGIPVVSTRVIPISRILTSCDAGVIADENDISSVVNCLIQLKSPELRNRLGGNGFNAVINRYNWNYDKDLLIKSIFSKNKKL
jgi:glycosyltransferase involved in cell wall biosynthesis